MVHFHSIAAFLATALSVAHVALGGSTSPKSFGKGGPTFHVLTGNSEEACSQDKVAVLRTRLTEAITLAKAASTALKVKGVETSPAFKEYLGNADRKKMEAQHYAPIAGIASADLKAVTSDEGHKPDVKATAPAQETLLMCFPADDDRCTRPDGKATSLYAVAVEAEQALIFCPSFFEKEVTRVHPKTKADLIVHPLSLAEGKTAYLAGKGAYDMGALVLLHELQHIPSVVGAHVLVDLYIKAGAPSEIVPRPADLDAKPKGIVGAYARKDCVGLPEDKKSTNTQNVAYFALDVYADPARAKPVKGTSDASKSSNVLSKVASKVGAKVGSKTPKRFEAIHRRRADKGATADPEA